MDLLNNLPVLLSGSAVFREGDIYQREGQPGLKFVTSVQNPAGISVSPDIGGFLIGINGFTPGVSMTSRAEGTWNGRNIVLYTVASRVAELGPQGIYKIDFLVAAR